MYGPAPSYLLSNDFFVVSHNVVMLFQCLLDLLFLFIFLTGLVNCFTYDTCQKQFLSTRAQFTSLSSKQSHSLTVSVHSIRHSTHTFKKGLSQRFNRNGDFIAVCTFTALLCFRQVNGCFEYFLSKKLCFTCTMAPLHLQPK